MPSTTTTKKKDAAKWESHQPLVNSSLVDQELLKIPDRLKADK
jgi:hypothetical protein